MSCPTSSSTALLPLVTGLNNCEVHNTSMLDITGVSRGLSRRAPRIIFCAAIAAVVILTSLGTGGQTVAFSKPLTTKYVEGPASPSASAARSTQSSSASSMATQFSKPSSLTEAPAKDRRNTDAAFSGDQGGSALYEAMQSAKVSFYSLGCSMLMVASAVWLALRRSSKTTKRDTGFLQFGNDTYRSPHWCMLSTVEPTRTMEGATGEAQTAFVAETLLPTSHGTYRVRSYRHTADGLIYSDPIAIICGSPEGQEEVPIRVHDACWTSEVLGSLKCDCAQQLQQALDFIRENELGIVMYLHQEGRGIGLANKIAAYRMQEKGLDTVAANRVLGLPDDCREYSAVKAILDDLGVKSVQLMTNNPRKVRELRGLGIAINKRLSCIVADPGVLASSYLSTKEEQMGHFLREEPDVDVLCPLDERAKSAERFGFDGAHGDGGF